MQVIAISLLSCIWRRKPTFIDVHHDSFRRDKLKYPAHLKISQILHEMLQYYGNFLKHDKSGKTYFFEK